MLPWSFWTRHYFILTCFMSCRSRWWRLPKSNSVCGAFKNINYHFASIVKTRPTKAVKSSSIGFFLENHMRVFSLNTTTTTTTTRCDATFSMYVTMVVSHVYIQLVSVSLFCNFSLSSYSSFFHVKFKWKKNVSNFCVFN